MNLKSDPFAQGLPREVAIALLECWNAPDRAMQAKYHRTPHFAALKEAARELYKTCGICGKAPSGMTVHHRHYRSLFREHLTHDVVLVCSRCHAHIHRRG